MRSRSLLFGAVALLVCGVCSFGQYGRPNLTKGVGIDQRLNSPVPLDLPFTDEANRAVTLRDYFGKKPVVLALVYYSCPNICNLTLNETVHSLKRVSLEPGRDYNVVVVSIDPAETADLAAKKKANYGKEFGRASFSDGWHFLTGQQGSISRLADAVGFHYRWDEASRQFVHAGGIMIATPEGRLSRYFYGLQYAPADMRMSLVAASHEQIGSPVDYILLFCFHYDALQGKYTLAIFNLLKVAGTLTVLGLAALLYGLSRKSKRPELTGTWTEASHVR